MLSEITHAAVPIVWAGVGLAALYLRHLRQLAQINAGRSAPTGEIDALTNAPDSAHSREVAQLRDRVRVLERIATDAARHDSSHTLAAQIDALKD
jgi:hypothetical protein